MRGMIILIFTLFVTACCKEDLPEISISELDLCLVELNGMFEDVEPHWNAEYLNGAEDGLERDILSAIMYPVEAVENQIAGTAIVHYVITAQGTVENLEIIQSPGSGLGEALRNAVRRATSGVSFSPGALNGAAVRIKKGVSAEFRIN